MEEMEWYHDRAMCLEGEMKGNEMDGRLTGDVTVERAISSG